jgi:DNA invertase Pin-like site-specific DNA recombinase
VRDDSYEYQGRPYKSISAIARAITGTRWNGLVSVTQSFNTTTSMGRLTLNILLSFAQFEREVIGERIRDKFAASRRKGMWMGGFVMTCETASSSSTKLRSQRSG